MKKLKLNLDEIKVESFEVSRKQEQAGTVFGQTGQGCQTINYTNCDTCPGWECNTNACPTAYGQVTCDAYNTCWQTCGGGNTCDNGMTCGVSCQGTCYEWDTCVNPACP